MKLKRKSNYNPKDNDYHDFHLANLADIITDNDNYLVSKDSVNLYSNHLLSASTSSINSFDLYEPVQTKTSSKEIYA